MTTLRFVKALCSNDLRQLYGSANFLDCNLPLLTLYLPDTKTLVLDGQPIAALGRQSVVVTADGFLIYHPDRTEFQRLDVLDSTLFDNLPPLFSKPGLYKVEPGIKTRRLKDIQLIKLTPHKRIETSAYIDFVAISLLNAFDKGFSEDATEDVLAYVLLPALPMDIHQLLTVIENFDISGLPEVLAQPGIGVNQLLRMWALETLIEHVWLHIENRRRAKRFEPILTDSVGRVLDGAASVD